MRVFDLRILAVQGGENVKLFHAPTRKLVVDLNSIESAALSLRYALQQIRICAGLPFGPYKREGVLTPADHAQKGIIDAAKKLGIDLGADWGNQLDLQDP